MGEPLRFLNHGSRGSREAKRRGAKNFNRDPGYQSAMVKGIMVKPPPGCGVRPGGRELRTVFSFGLTDGVARNLGRRGAAALEPEELASNPELRGVVETLCNSLKEGGGQKGR